jgi:hypothetical protein
MFDGRRLTLYLLCHECKAGKSQDQPLGEADPEKRSRRKIINHQLQFETASKNAVIDIQSARSDPTAPDQLQHKNDHRDQHE